MLWRPGQGSQGVRESEVRDVCAVTCVCVTCVSRRHERYSLSYMCVCVSLAYNGNSTKSYVNEAIHGTVSTYYALDGGDARTATRHYHLFFFFLVAEPEPAAAAPEPPAAAAGSCSSPALVGLRGRKHDQRCAAWWDDSKGRRGGRQHGGRGRNRAARACPDRTSVPHRPPRKVSGYSCSLRGAQSARVCCCAIRLASRAT